MSGGVRIRFVCSGQGRHRERTLATVDAPAEGSVVPVDPATGRSFQRDHAQVGRGARINAVCPSCGRNATYSEATVVRIAERFTGTAPVVVIDVATGAIDSKD